MGRSLGCLGVPEGLHWGSWGFLEAPCAVKEVRGPPDGGRKNRAGACAPPGGDQNYHFRTQKIPLCQSPNPILSRIISKLTWINYYRREEGDIDFDMVFTCANGARASETDQKTTKGCV